MKKKLFMAAARVFGVVAIVVVFIWVLVAQPSCRQSPVSAGEVSPTALRAHVEALSSIRFHPRDWQHHKNLEACADYITDHLSVAGAEVHDQPVTAGGRSYRNVIGRFAEERTPRIVVGAHYDSCDETPGADDNASGIAVLIELAKLFGQMESPPPVDLVAYTLEEPPFFGTDQMGSCIHAQSLKNNKESVLGVIVLEMVGYFSDERGSQSYPLPLLYFLYPRRGNTIAVVGRWDQGSWVKSVKVGMKGATDLPVYSIRAPASLPGVDFSDHRNYWPQGINALMVTDTAFYRNPMYHTLDDKADTLDYDRMAKVAVAVCSAVNTLASR
jgi:hypothetical protein